jgi:hypothetical protein
MRNGHPHLSLTKPVAAPPIFMVTPLKPSFLPLEILPAILPFCANKEKDDNKSKNRTTDFFTAIIFIAAKVEAQCYGIVTAALPTC